MDVDTVNSELKGIHDSARDLTALRGGSLANRTQSSRSIANMVETRALTPAELEQRRVIHRDAASRAPADAFRELRMRLLALGGADNFVTLVVPVSSGSGGSFVARNLAAAFAFDESRTALLIDCNLRYPTQHVSLNVDPASGGLIDYLEQPSRNIQGMLYSTGIPRMRLIPAGQVREATSESFSSYRMRSLIDALRVRYPDRYLFLDGPPLTGSPDACILSDLADIVVVVAAYGRDSSAQINQAAASLDSNKLAGVVFNQPP